MDRIGADDPDLARRVVEEHVNHRQRMSESPHPNQSAAVATVRFLFLVLFTIAAVAIVVKMIWLLLAALFGV